MNLIYQDSRTTLYHADNRQVWPLLPLCDVCITDPPYHAKTHQGAKSAPKKAGFRSAKSEWHSGGNEPAPLLDFDAFAEHDLYLALRAIAAVTRTWVVLTCDYHHAATIENWCESGEYRLGEQLRFVRFGLYIKSDGPHKAPNSAPQFTGDRPGTGWEAVAILHRRGGRMRWHGGGKHGIWYAPIDSTKRLSPNPTAKAPRLVRQFIADFTNPGDLILDPFCGSGTVLVESRRMGRRSIGIERSDRDAVPLAAYLHSLEYEQVHLLGVA